MNIHQNVGAIIDPQPPPKPREWAKNVGFRPRENRDNLTGISQFATIDGTLYERGRNGVIRSMHSKIRSKKERVHQRRIERAAARRAAEQDAK